MPLFRLAKQWLDPHGAFAHRLGVSFRTVVLADPLAVRLVERTVELPALTAVGTLGADRAGLTDSGGSLVDADLGRVVVAPKAQDGALRAAVDVRLRLVGEVALAEERTALAPVRQWHIGADPVGGQSLEVLPRSVRRIADRPPGSHLPAKADASQQIQHGDVLHHVGRRD